jgi:hypothetical protein
MKIFNQEFIDLVKLKIFCIINNINSRNQTKTVKIFR